MPTLSRFCRVAGAVCLTLTGALAQVPKILTAPVKIDATISGKFNPKFMRMNKLSNQANTQMAAGQDVVVSVPHWSGSFTYKNTVYPYTMVGRDPRHGGTVSIPTSVVPVSFYFDCCVDAQGNNIVVDVAPELLSALQSPNFLNSSYGTGYTQFADAVQRAEFYRVMDDDWHTRLLSPRGLTPVRIEVPPDTDEAGNPIFGFPAQTPDGTLLAIVQIDFFVSHLNTLIQFEGFRTDEIPMVLSRNGLFFEDPDNAFGTCCILGFHTAYETQVQGNSHFTQTFITASYLDPGIFTTPGFEDVLPLSHEISETFNDPFINNATPPWEFPDNSGCQANLETGDPVEVLANPAFPVTLHGFTYHPQTEALLQWFSRKHPSNAYQHAYSYPDTTALTSPSAPCHK